MCIVSFFKRRKSLVLIHLDEHKIVLQKQCKYIQNVDEAYYLMWGKADFSSFCCMCSCFSNQFELY